MSLISLNYPHNFVLLSTCCMSKKLEVSFHLIGKYFQTWNLESIHHWKEKLFLAIWDPPKNPILTIVILSQREWFRRRNILIQFLRKLINKYWQVWKGGGIKEGVKTGYPHTIQVNSWRMYGLTLVWMRKMQIRKIR